MRTYAQISCVVYSFAKSATKFELTPSPRLQVALDQYHDYQTYIREIVAASFRTMAPLFTIQVDPR
jgi:hypothetical protein